MAATDPIRRRQPSHGGKFSSNILDEAMRPHIRSRGETVTGLWLLALRQLGENVRGLVYPAPLLGSLRPDLACGLPEPERTIGDHQLRRAVEPAPLEIEQQLPPIVRALTCAIGEPDEFLAALWRSADDDENVAKRIIAPGAFVVTDGLACFRGIADAGCTHHPIATSKNRHGAGHPSFHWANTVLANIKTAIIATYKAVRKKHLVRTLAEFEWRFNNRENLAAMIPLLASPSVRSKPATYSYLKCADYGA